MSRSDPCFGKYSSHALFSKWLRSVGETNITVSGLSSYHCVRMNGKTIELIGLPEFQPTLLDRGDGVPVGINGLFHFIHDADVTTFTDFSYMERDQWTAIHAPIIAKLSHNCSLTMHSPHVANAVQVLQDIDDFMSTRSRDTSTWTRDIPAIGLMFDRIHDMVVSYEQRARTIEQMAHSKLRPVDADIFCTVFLDANTEAMTQMRTLQSLLRTGVTASVLRVFMILARHGQLNVPRVDRHLSVWTNILCCMTAAPHNVMFIGLEMSAVISTFKREIGRLTEHARPIADSSFALCCNHTQGTMALKYTLK